jgi:ATP-dependent RNA helicase RhlE
MLGLAEPVLRAIKAGNYQTPTPIQSKAIPSLLEGRDLIGLAQTGTGKTAAFLLPLMHGLNQEKKARALPGTCRALILAPTRELAAQIHRSVYVYGKYVRPSCVLVVGGANPRPQMKALRAGVDICVATPGRLMDHMRSGAIRLNETHYVVLDEADQMMDLGFMPAIREILGKTAKDRQTLLFSATMPKQIRQLADQFLDKPEEVSVSPRSKPAETVDQRVRLLTGGEKKNALVEILADRDVTQAIVFTRTKRGADKVCDYLRKAGLDSVAIHGNRTQGQRDRALKEFRKGKLKILVATDIAARGLDINGVSHVVNYELPNVPESYVHRIGRTGRAGATGIAISLVDPSERLHLQQIEKLIERELISEQTPGWSPIDFSVAIGKTVKQRRRPARRRPGTSQSRPKQERSGAPARSKNRNSKKRRPKAAAGAV